MGIKIKPSELGKELRARAKKMPDVIRKGSYMAAQRGRSLLVRRTPVDRGLLKASWRAKRGSGKELATIENDAPYAGIVEFGARPHPVSREGQAAIALWAKRKFGLDEAEAKQVAYLIARRIRRRGQKPTYFVRDSLDEILVFYNKEIERAIQRQAKKKST